MTLHSLPNCVLNKAFLLHKMFFNLSQREAVVRLQQMFVIGL
jgi:hypothetical protein